MNFLLRAPGLGAQWLGKMLRPQEGCYLRRPVDVIPFLLIIQSLISCHTVQAQSEAPAASNSGHVSHSVRSTGSWHYAPQRWGSVGVSVQNSTAADCRVLPLVFQDQQPGRQYGRELWVPSRAVRSDWIPLQIPSTATSAGGGMAFKSLLVEHDQASQQDILLRTRSGLAQEDILLPAAEKGPSIGVIADADDGPAVDAVVALRLNRALSRRLYMLDNEFYSAGEETLAGLDQLVLMSDRIMTDALAMTAVRHWLNGGGRLWIMLDQVEPQTVTCLLGDACDFQVVDRITLTECTIKSNSPGTIGPEGLFLQFESPLNFVRTLVPHGKVLQTINNWPVAFLGQSGKGTILFTTLAGHGWVRPRGDGETLPLDPKHEVSLLANPALEEVSVRFSEPRPDPALESEDFQGYVAQQIGYRVLHRGIIAAVLVTFCLSWGGLGLWLTRRKQAEQAAWIGPILALVATIGLLLVGRQIRQIIPDTVVIAELLEVNQNNRDAELTGLLGIYQQSASTQPLGAKAGGVFVPPHFEDSGEIQRMVWTDHDQWQLEPAALPAGLCFAPCRYSGKLPGEISATATFGPEGLEGQLEIGPMRNAADAVIAMPGGDGLAVALADGGKFTGNSRARFAPGTFITGSLLTDEQRRRQAIYQKILRDRRGYPTQPRCLVWTDPLDLDWKFASRIQQRGSALLVIPLRFERPVPGRQITIPSPVLTYQSIGASGAYNQKDGQWGKLSYPRPTTLRFQIPAEILPFQLEHADLTITIDAPGRTLEITDGRTADATVWQRFESPVGVVTCRLEAANRPQPDERGGLVVGINVGDVAGMPQSSSPSAASSFWQIRDVQLEISGQAADSPAAE